MIRFALIVASTLGFFLTAAFGNLLVPLLRAFRPGPKPGVPEQPTPDQAPEDPEQEPERVPTLGGVCVMAGTLAAVGVGWTAACIAQPDLLGSENLLTSRLLIALFGAMAFGAVGMADDVVRLRRKAPLGLRTPVRLALEAAAAAAELALLAARHCLASGLTLPGLGYVELGWAAPLVWGVGLIALAECARTADGADGTVCAAAFAAMLGLMAALTVLGWFPLAVLPAALAGALMAFLIWNFPPAKLLPGAVGCQFLAGAIGCVPLSIGWPGLAVPLALPFWVEGGMVALQILVFRFSRGKKQLFATAPLHRWLEKRGLGPIAIFYFFSVLALVGFTLAVQLARFS